MRRRKAVEIVKKENGKEKEGTSEKRIKKKEKGEQHEFIC